MQGLTSVTVADQNLGTGKMQGLTSVSSLFHEEYKSYMMIYSVYPAAENPSKTKKIVKF
jgi:hypothetical protein